MYDKAFFSPYGAFMPGAAATLTPKVAGDSDGTTISLTQVRFRSATAEEVLEASIPIQLGVTYAKVSIWDNGEGAAPKVGDKVTRTSTGATYRLLTVKTTIAENLWSCLAIPEVA